MAQRKNIFKVDSVDVQGEGSWVKLRKLPWARQQEAQRLLAEAAGGTLPSDPTAVTVTTAFLDVNKDFTVEMLRESVVAWDWVDDEGQPLPLPKTTEALALLSAEEVQFLVVALQGKKEALKN